MFANIQARIDARLAAAERFRFNPVFYEGLTWAPCTVNILMVADDFIYFSDEDFGLSDLINILKSETLSYVRFKITVAHRGNPSDARVGMGNPQVSASIRNFKFDDVDDFKPASYDQVWLFGSQRSRKSGANWTNRLTESELRTLTEFMDAGGGVFATGDHEDLGAAMGGFLPRVRQMRRWFFPNTGPNGEGLAPPFEGPGRFDTNRVGHDAGYQFNDQSDDIPQPISPKVYTTQVGPFREASYPHPVLCGPNGTIRVLPDHPHESQCTTAAAPNATSNLDGKSFTEFKPAIDGGPRPLPEVIATASVIGGHSTSGKTGNTVSRNFGAIAAYDGHRAGVGRCVTDSTWHHFINVNLTGASSAGGAKAIGFLASVSGQAHLAEIAAYFTNIALWISPKSKLRCMRNWGLLAIAVDHRLVEVFDPAIRLKNARLIDMVVYGRHARDAIGKLAGPCNSLRWTWDFVLAEIDHGIFIDMGDPWRPRVPELKEGDRTPDLEELKAQQLLDLEWVGDAALGGAMLALREKAFPLQQKALDGFDESGDTITQEGARAALKRALPFVASGLAEMATLAKAGFVDGKKPR